MQARFDGFCESVGGMTGGGAYQTTYRRFKFARADAGADEGPEVRLWHACLWGRGGGGPATERACAPQALGAERFAYSALWQVISSTTAAPS